MVRLPNRPKSWKAMRAQRKRVEASISPRRASAYDWGRSDIEAKKGEKDGNCNRTACQRPLLGRKQWFMDGNFTGGPRLYYCDECARDFTRWDMRSGDPIRCTLDETTVDGTTERQSGKFSLEDLW